MVSSNGFSATLLHVFSFTNTIKMPSDHCYLLKITKIWWLQGTWNGRHYLLLLGCSYQLGSEYYYVTWFPPTVIVHFNGWYVVGFGHSFLVKHYSLFSYHSGLTRLLFTFTLFSFHIVSQKTYSRVLLFSVVVILHRVLPCFTLHCYVTSTDLYVHSVFHLC